MIKSRLIKMVLFVFLTIGGYAVSSAQQAVSFDVQRDVVVKSNFTLEFSNMDAVTLANLQALKAKNDPMFGSFVIDANTNKVSVNCLYSDMGEHGIQEYFRTHLGLQPAATKKPVNAVNQETPASDVQSTPLR